MRFGEVVDPVDRAAFVRPADQDRVAAVELDAADEEGFGAGDLILQAEVAGDLAVALDEDRELRIGRQRHAARQLEAADLVDIGDEVAHRALYAVRFITADNDRHRRIDSHHFSKM